MNISGKDFLTEQEAAHYACVSKSQFQAKAKNLGIKSGMFMGKKVYRKADILKSMEQEWHLSSGEAKTKTLRTSVGTKKESKLKSALARSKSTKLNK